MAAKKFIFILPMLLLLPAISFALSDCSQCGGACYTTDQALQQGNLVRCEGAQFEERCGESNGLPQFCWKSPTCGNNKCDAGQDITCPNECQMQPVCGNNVCETDESASSCPQDCQPSEPTLPGATASFGIKNPAPHTWHYDESSTDIWNEMLQIKINNDGAEDITLLSITLQASGSGNDATDINRIEIYVDANNDGSVGAADIKIGSAQPAYANDNGKTIMGLNYNVQKGDTKVLLIAYVMGNNAPAGATYEFTVTAIKAAGKATGMLFGVKGLPITSNTKTIVAAPALACKGPIGLQLNPDTTSAGKLVNAVASGLQNCAGQKVEIQSQACNFLLKILPQCSCVVPAVGNGCGCNFAAPDQDGEYKYYACADISQNSKVDAGEEDSAKLKVATCKGTPALSFNPNPVQPGQQATATASGLQNCFGKVFVTRSEVIVECIFDSQDSGGTCTIIAPDKEGTYTYSAVTDVNGNGWTDAGEYSSSDLVVAKQPERAKPGKQNTETPQGVIGSKIPISEQCTDCTPQTWSECKAVSGAEGTQRGTCENNCGYTLVKWQACTAGGFVAKPVQQQPQTNTATIAALAVLIGAGAAYYLYSRKKTKRKSK